jgi:hypothetical protein
VTFRRSGARLTLVSAVPAPRWRVEVEQAAGAEIEVDFRQGSRRVQVKLELGDGVVRERIRIRDKADGSDILIENGVVVRTEPGDRADDRVDDDRVGDDNRGPGGDDAVEDNSNSGPGSSGDHRVDGNSNSGPGSGHGADDPAGDDHGGHRGSDG